jgi:hypothetical protein
MVLLRNPKRFMGVVAFVLLISVFSVADTTGDKKDKKGGCTSSSVKGCQGVPDGGSTASYLLALGATCLGGMVLRSRYQRSQ